MSVLRDEITTEFELIHSSWPEVRSATKARILAMKSYYSSTENRQDAVEKTDSDRTDLKDDMESHEDLASRALGIQRNLNTQVESSENRVQRMNKHGRIAALAFPIICAVVGGVIGAKVPGWGQVVAIVVGAILAFIIFGVLALVVYFYLKWRFIKRRDMWKEVQENNQGSVALVSYIKEKKSDLSEIQDLLNDIEEDNMDSAIAALLDKMSEYLNDDH